MDERSRSSRPRSSSRDRSVGRPPREGSRGAARRGATRGGRSTAGSRPRSAEGARRRNLAAGPRRPQPLMVPLVPVVAFLLVAVLSSVLLTRCVMKPRIDEAREEATAAKKEAVSLRNQVDRLEEEVKSAEAQASAQGLDSPWTSTGKFTSGDDTLDKEVKEFCDANCTTDQTKEDAALAVYTAIAWSDYVERDDAQHPAGANWRIEYARKYYEHDCSGNCYEFAAFLMYCMRYMGYDDALCQGVEIEFEGGNWGDHGIVFVTNTDGSECLCDTARGVDGWMLGLGVYNYRIMDFETA